MTLFIYYSLNVQIARIFSKNVNKEATIFLKKLFSYSQWFYVQRSIIYIFKKVLIAYFIAFFLHFPFKFCFNVKMKSLL